MPILLINGNTNQHTFANASLAANFDSRRKFGKGLDAVFVAHSKESYKLLPALGEWTEHLEANGLNPASFVQVQVDLEKDPTLLADLAGHIERFMCIVPPKDHIYVDLTNGLSLQKAALGAVAYVLGANDQFIINPHRIGKVPPNVGFLDEAELAGAMVRVSEPLTFDRLALIWYTEVRRFRGLASASRIAVDKLLPEDDSISSALWETEVLQAVKLWLAGQINPQGALFGGAVRHVGLAFEELLQGMRKRLLAESKISPKQTRKRLDLKRLIEDVTAGIADEDLRKEVCSLGDSRHCGFVESPWQRRMLNCLMTPP